MLPGPTRICECSACKNHILRPSYVSWNTFGAKIWSDGRTTLPLGPEELSLIKCQHCQRLVWIDELAVVSQKTWGLPISSEDEFSDAIPASCPNFSDYMDFLDREVKAEQKVRYVRIHAWWASNDKHRHLRKSISFSDDETDNLLALITLLDEDNENDRIMKAEALRELGGFSSAKKLLEKSFSDHLEQVSNFLLLLIEQKRKTVEEIELT